MIPRIDTPTTGAWTGASKGSAAGTRIFIRLISLFGRPPAYALLVLVSAWYALTDRTSAAALRSMRNRLGLPTRRIDFWRHFFHFGISMIDRLAYLLGKTEFAYTGYDGRTPESILPPDRGAIVISAHVGNWEVAGNALGDTRTVNVIMVDNERPRIRELFQRALSRRRINVIPFGRNMLEPAFAIKAALDRHEIVCMHGDRSIGRNDETADFLGAPALFPRGPFEIAAITGAALTPVFAVRESWKRYRLIILSPISVHGSDRDAAIRSAVREYAAALEKTVRAYPYEWYNFYDFWHMREDRNHNGHNGQA